MAGGDLIPDAAPHPVRPDLVGRGHDERGDRRAAGGKLGQRGDFQITEDGHRDRARDRRGGHHQQVRRAVGPGPQHVPLLDPETVLLVHDHQSEVAEGHRFFEERMRAHHQTGAAVRHGRERLAPRPQPERTRHQGDPGRTRRGIEFAGPPQRTEQVTQAAQMLGGERLGGRQEYRLTARVDGGEHSPQRHHRLAGTDLTLQQPVHGERPGDLGRDGLADRALPGGQRKRHGRVERGQQAVRPGVSCGRRGLLVVEPTLRERDLQDESLVPLEPGPAASDVRPR